MLNLLAMKKFGKGEKNMSNNPDELDEMDMEKITETFYSVIKRIDALENENQELKDQLTRQSMRAKILESDVDRLNKDVEQLMDKITDIKTTQHSNSPSYSSGRSGATDMPDMDVERTM